MSNQELIIRVDARERGKIIARLESLEGVKLEIEDLEHGDYILPNGVVVERKSATDFILSVVDEGVWAHVEALAQTFHKVVYIIEGDPYVARFHQKALDVHRAFARMILEYNVAVIPSSDADNTAMMVFLLAQGELSRNGPSGPP
ncbi:MAG: ERCC4 domain-containing protein [Acidiferrobacter sp.]